MTPEEIAKFAAETFKALRSKTANNLPNTMPVFSVDHAFQLTKAALEIRLSVTPVQFDW